MTLPYESSFTLGTSSCSLVTSYQPPMLINIAAYINILFCCLTEQESQLWGAAVLKWWGWLCKFLLHIRVAVFRLIRAHLPRRYSSEVRNTMSEV